MDALPFSQACENNGHHNIHTGQLAKFRRLPTINLIIVSSDPLILDKPVLIVPAKFVASLKVFGFCPILFPRNTSTW